MAAPAQFEALILGSGAGGKLLAWHLAHSGRRTAVVERHWIGGSRPNVNCMPSKNEISSASVAHAARHSAAFRTKTGRVTIDLVKVPQPQRGYVGLEFGQAYRRFGSRVTIIEHGSQLLSREDPDVSEEMQRILSAEGVECLVAAQTLHVHGRSGKDVTVTVCTAAGEQRIEGSDILVAAGRTPNTAGIGLEEAGGEVDARGYGRANKRLETSAPDVWAIGECAGSPHFTHASVDDFRIIMDNLARGKRNTRPRPSPRCPL